MRTSDERREVAEALRQMADEHDVVHAFDNADIRKLADLIDPTCRRERKRVVVDDYRRDTLILPVCSACGFTFDKRMPKPNFCPHCGSRVVDE